jgi:ribosomal-protein-alanine N-acetyltransferase
MLASQLTTPRLLLRNLKLDDVGHEYREWLCDPAVNRYLEVRFQEHTKAAIEAFIYSVNQSPDSVLFGIFLIDDGRHIGNIKLGCISQQHRRAEISLLIGDRAEWGKGYATEAICAVTEFGLGQLGLNKIAAGIYEENIGSKKAFLRAGYRQEARLPDHWNIDGKFQAQLWLGFTRPCDSLQRPPPCANFLGVRSVVFIGGGKLMIAAALQAKKLGYDVNAIVAPRHAAETLNNGRATESELSLSGIEVFIVPDINVWDNLTASVIPGSLALCFGPAWIFSKKVIETFTFGMFNFNGIPIPHYLGGAHYTWQILNSNRRGGCFVQCITDQVNQGDILRYEYFDLPADVKIPKDYFDANFAIGLEFLSRFLEDVKNGIVFQKISFNEFNTRRLYFPRLFTRENAYIDWRWSGFDIERFCNAFDEPYPGAATFWRNFEVRLLDVRFCESDEHFHPYVSGLVVRKLAGRIWIAVLGGTIEVTALIDTDGQSVIAEVREGDRLATPNERLWHSNTFSAKFNSQGIVM